MPNKTVNYFLNELDKLKQTYVSTKNIKEFSDNLDKIKNKLEKEDIPEKDFEVIKERLLGLSDFLKDKKNTKKIEKQNKTIDYFVKELDKLKKTNVDLKDVKEFSDKLNKIKSILEQGYINEEEFNLIENELFNLAVYLQDKKKKENIEKKLKKKKTIIPKKEKTISKPINIPELEKPKEIITPVKTITKPIQIKTTANNKNLLDFKNQLDKRIENLKEIKTERSENELFNYFIEEINDIISEIAFSFEVEDLRESYKDLKIIENNLSLFKDKLSIDEYNVIKKELIKLGKYLQSLLLEKGVKFKKGEAILKEETIKGKVKKFIKEQKFEGAGGLLFALTDSPLLMILGKQVDDFFGKKREKKEEEEKKQIEKLSEIYKIKSYNKKKKSRNDIIEKLFGMHKIKSSDKKKKSKSVENNYEEKNDIIEKTFLPQLPLEKEMETDEEYKKMLSDLKLMADESADELDLSQETRDKISDEIDKIEPEKEDEEPDKEEKKSLTKKRERKKIDDENVYEILKKHLPNIDVNIEELVKKYKEANDEQKVTERDATLKNIAQSLSEKKETTGDEKEIKQKGIKDLIPYVGTIGKVLAGAGAFTAGWFIGKELDKLLDITPAIQNIVDKLQGSLDDYYQESLKRTNTEKQIERTRKTQTLKEKIETETFSNKEIYELMQKDKTILDKLNADEKRIITGKAKMYEKMSRTGKEKVMDENLISIAKNKPLTDIPGFSDIKTQNQVKMSIPAISDTPIVNKAFEEYKSKSIENFNTEKADNILNTSILNKTEKKDIDEKQDLSSVSPGKNVNVKDLNPVVKGNLFSMATEYKEDTGKSLPINSAYRTIQDQERLYKENPGKAAKPGTSMHEKGMAVDIDTPIVNDLKTTGLLKKYGFDTPVSGETWHIEPTSIRKQYITNLQEKTNMSQVGENRLDKRKNVNYNQEGNVTNNSNMAFAQNNYIVNPSDFRTFIDDPFLFQELRNNYG